MNNATKAWGNASKIVWVVASSWTWEPAAEHQGSNFKDKGSKLGSPFGLAHSPLAPQISPPHPKKTRPSFERYLAPPLPKYNPPYMVPLSCSIFFSPCSFASPFQKRPMKDRSLGTMKYPPCRGANSAVILA